MIALPALMIITVYGVNFVLLILKNILETRKYN